MYFMGIPKPSNKKMKKEDMGKEKNEQKVVSFMTKNLAKLPRSRSDQKEISGRDERMVDRYFRRILKNNVVLCFPFT